MYHNYIMSNQSYNVKVRKMEEERYWFFADCSDKMAEFNEK